VFKLFFAFLVTVTVVVFAIDNLHSVRVGLIVGPQFEVRLFFLLATVFLLGCVTTVLVQLYGEAAARSRRDAEPRGAEPHGLEEDFFTP